MEGSRSLQSVQTVEPKPGPLRMSLEVVRYLLKCKIHCDWQKIAMNTPCFTIHYMKTL